jgi:hypothetical protein
LLDCIYDLERDSPSMGRLVACLMGLLKLMDAAHFRDLWTLLSPKVAPVPVQEPCYGNKEMGNYSLNTSRSEHVDDRNPLKDLLEKFTLVFKEIVVGKIFATDWLVMDMATNE